MCKYKTLLCGQGNAGMDNPPFNMKSDFVPRGDQPKAIESLENSFKNNTKFNTLLGVTGSGKTFTVAHLIQRLE